MSRSLSVAVVDVDFVEDASFVTVEPWAAAAATVDVCDDDDVNAITDDDERTMVHAAAATIDLPRPSIMI